MFMRRINRPLFWIGVLEAVFWISACTAAAEPAVFDLNGQDLAERWPATAQAKPDGELNKEIDDAKYDAVKEVTPDCVQLANADQARECAARSTSSTKPQHPHGCQSSARYNPRDEVGESDGAPSQNPKEGPGFPIDQTKLAGANASEHTSPSPQKPTHEPAFVYIGSMLLVLLLLHFFTNHLNNANSALVVTLVALLRPAFIIHARFASMAIDLALLALFASGVQHLGECSQHTCSINSLDGMAALASLGSIVALLQLHGGIWVKAALGFPDENVEHLVELNMLPTAPCPLDMTLEARHVGILAMDVYFPNAFVSQGDLEKHDCVPTGKYTVGLGQLNMAVCDDLEDASTMALTAVHSLLRKYNVDPCQIGRVEVGTESLNDYSKSVKTSLMQLFADAGNTDVEGCQSLNACYGGTAAVLNSIAWLESSACDGRLALVVASDVAAYAPGPARATGGAGAVAMLLGPNAPLSFEAVRASHSEDAYDLYMPKSDEGASEFPVVDGKLANDCYISALDECYQSFTKKVARASGEVVSLKSADYLLFHSPYNKLVMRSLARMAWNDYKLHGHYLEELGKFQDLEKAKAVNDRDLDLACRELTGGAYEQKVLPGTLLPRQCGNSHTASLYMSLASLLTAKSPKDLMGKRITMFSYGSGLVSTLFSIRVRGDTGRISHAMDILTRLAKRTQVSAEQYAAAMDRRAASLGKASITARSEAVAMLEPGTFYIENVSATRSRSFAMQPLPSPAKGEGTPTRTAALMAGHDAYQIALMNERCIAVDMDDHCVGPVSKEVSHLNVLAQPEQGAMLHRAFSVLLFNTKGQLLLQQRAPEKITFPKYWANTCCSHPLFTDAELEENGQLGVKRAAQRKLLHELGVEAHQIPLECFNFVTRFHYAATSDKVWGEHEIDYVLIAQADVDLEVNPKEVCSTRYVSRDTLKDLLKQADAGEELVSPWFRLLCDTVLSHWWTALENGAIRGMRSEKIHRLMDKEAQKEMVAASEVMLKKALAEAKEAPSKKACLVDLPPLEVKPEPKKSKFKKIMSILNQLSHPRECVALARFLSAGKKRPCAHCGDDKEAECFRMLQKTSRSFAAVIDELHEELRTPICVFYLVLRVLDSVEDDMRVPHAVKKELLLDFYLRLNDPETCTDGIQGMGDTTDYVELVMKFGAVVHTAHRACTAAQREVISEITKRMGAGMASFVGVESLATKAEYDLYCHYVAGLVGIGLSKMFACAQCEGPHMGTDHFVADTGLSNEMGLFLQKVNITRDYLEDVDAGRPWWPREVWSKYAPSARALQQSPTANACLNELLCDALEHAPACIEYLRSIKDPTVFKFCAVPQVMAIATLSELYDNHGVFEGVVKIRKGMALQLMEGATDLASVMSIFRRFACDMLNRINPADPHARRTHHALQKILHPQPVSWGACITTQDAVCAGDLMNSHMALNRKGVDSAPAKSPALVEKEEEKEVAQVSCEEFIAAFEPIKEELSVMIRSLVDPATHPVEVDEIGAWVDRLVWYAGPGGKLNRGLTVCHTFDMLKPGASEVERHQAMVLGWAVELLQAFFLVADDVMDQSRLRRGKPCWYTLPDVGLKAVNDSFILESCCYLILKKFLATSSCYAHVLELFLECSLRTELGQALDLNTETAAGQGTADLNLQGYTMARVQAIAKHKTAYYSFYLPVALGMSLAGLRDKSVFAAAQKICIGVGVCFQAQDDFLDCYGSPEVIGKVGTDIESAKCSWLIAKVLEMCSVQQKETIRANYGQWDTQKVAVIKGIFEELKVGEAYHEYEEHSYKELCAMAESETRLPKEVFHALIAKVYKRSK